MESPERPGVPPSTRQRSWLTIFIVVNACLLGAVVLLVLPTGFIGPVAVMGGLLFSAVFGFHYLVWGRWLTRLLEDEAREQGD